MNEKKIDIFLKEKAKSEQIEISSEVEKSINHALNNLPKHRNRIKPAMAVAAILIASFISISVISPAYAENIPLIKSVFEFFGKSGDYTNKQYLTYATPVNQSVTDKDFTITVNEVAVDDNFIVISYIVKGTKPLSKDFSSEPYSFGKLTLGGKLVTNGTGQAEMIDEFSFVQQETYFVGRNNMPEKLDFKYEVDQINNTHGEWNFSFNISKQGISKESKVVYPNVTVSLPFAKLKVSRVVQSPFANSLIYNLTYTKQPYHYGFFVLDDKGKALYVIGEGHSKGTTSVEQNLFFVKGKEELKKITLIPFTFDSNYDLNPIKWLSKSTKSLPIEFLPNNKSKIIVNKIEYDKLKTKVYYTVEGQYPYGYAVKVVLFDNGKELFPIGKADQLIDPETNQFVTEFDRLDDKREYEVATPQLNDLIIFNDNKISIPIK